MPNFDFMTGGGFMPHGFCLRWDVPLVTTWIAANMGIAVAYFAIPAALVYFVRKRRQDIPYPWMFILFAMFIIACGVTHLMKIYTLYQPYYWAEVLVDCYTAIVSLLTAILLWPLIPRALALRSPTELEVLNKKLLLTNEDLEITRDRALEASNLKSAFVANISHELRTPLSGIIGMNELLLKTKLDDDQRQMVQMMQDSGNSLLAIVNDILDLSRIEAGKMSIECIKVNVISIIHDCAQMLSNVANKRGVSIKVDIDSRILPVLYGDPIRLHQVILNLFSNAVKFTHQGQILLQALIESENVQNLVIKFSVTDTGIGMSEAEQKYLFMPFTQVDGSSTRLYGGVGLGLAISKRLVELMGGNIGVTSSKGFGSTFWFTAPLKRFADLVQPVIPITHTDAVLPTDQLVLVVEDDPTLQKLVLLQLTNLGISGRVVADGQAALEELARRKYRLVLMDCYLPILDGFETTRILRQQEAISHDHIVIIAMTAGAMRGDSEKCLNAGMDDYLSKPYTLEELRRKLVSWLAVVDKTKTTPE